MSRDANSGTFKSGYDPRRVSLLGHTFTHGQTRNGRATPTWSSYASMLRRCDITRPYPDPKYSWNKYAGRPAADGGPVKIYEPWLERGPRNSPAPGFFAFLAYMGERPPGTTLDRYPNPHGDYEPGNVR